MKGNFIFSSCVGVLGVVLTFFYGIAKEIARDHGDREVYDSFKGPWETIVTPIQTLWIDIWPSFLKQSAIGQFVIIFSLWAALAFLSSLILGFAKKSILAGFRGLSDR